MNRASTAGRPAGRDSNQNQRTYNSPDVVFVYARRQGLQPPEARVRELLAPRLRQMAMLDIGVGGGRTAEHFLGQTAEYTAIDYCPRMVQAARRRFPASAAAFILADARQLDAFPDERFDFVLYSYNGLDYMGHQDRLRAMLEVRRVTRRGGLFCFSSHNLRAVPTHLWPPFQNPVHYLRELYHRAQLRLLNGRDTLQRTESKPYEVIRDMPRLLSYYVSPAEQLRQLDKAGFGGTRMFGLRHGAELPGVAEAERSTDPWIYYLCEAT